VLSLSLSISLNRGSMAPHFVDVRVCDTMHSATSKAGRLPRVRKPQHCIMPHHLQMSGGAYYRLHLRHPTVASLLRPFLPFLPFSPFPCRASQTRAALSDPPVVLLRP
jgi:hypothetical protein